MDCETRTETDNNSGKNNSEDTISKQAENTTVEEMTTQETDNFNLTLPPKMNTRGRPKGKQLTAIGLKRKRATTKEPVRFEEKTTTEKHRMLLECLVSIEDADSALKGQLLGESSANSTLGFLRRNLKACPPKLRETAYFSLVRSSLEYSSAVWDPFRQKDIDKLEKIQRSAARFVTQNYRQTASVTSLIQNLGWTDLKTRRKNSRLVSMFKILMS